MSLADTSVSFCHLHCSSYSVPDLDSNYESPIKAMSRHQRSNTHESWSQRADFMWLQLVDK